MHKTYVIADKQEGISQAQTTILCKMNASHLEIYSDKF